MGTLDDAEPEGGIARAELERLRARLAEAESRRAGAVRLQALTAALAHATTVDDVARVVLHEGVGHMGANAGMLLLLDEIKRCFRVAGVTGYSAGAVAAMGDVPVDAPLPRPDAVAQGAPVWVESREAMLARYPQAARGAPHESGAWAVLPIAFAGKYRGGISFGFPETRAFTDDERAFALALAGQCQLALERAQLISAERAARQRAEAGEARQRFLAEASALLASSLDYGTTLQRLAALAVPVLADYCTVDIVSDAGLIERLAIAHTDETRVARAREIHQRFPPSPDAAHGLTAVIRTGVPEITPVITDAMLERVPDPEYRAALRELGIRSSMVLPLRARERSLGALSFVRCSAERPFGPDDVALAEQLALRAAVAIDNARLYDVARRERARVEEVNRVKDEFLAAVSHELRTPLNAILGWTQILRSGSLTTAKAARALETVERNARSQAQLVEDLLDISRIVTGKIRLDVRDADAAAVVQAALDAVRPAAEARELTLHASLDPEAAALRADPDRLQQVFWNLLINAVKFTPRGGTVSVTLAREIDGSVALTVADTGEGIPPEFLPHVFERFRQADGGTARVHGGLGLGLSIARHLVELHGGTIEGRSEGRGRGATFVVRLPPQRTSDPARDPRASAANGGATVAPAGANIAGLRVLAVDDEPDALEILAMTLEPHGVTVLRAQSSNEAAEILQRVRPDVLVSDIGMPGQDGYALIGRVRALPPSAGGTTPALALTAYASADDRARALAAGFNAHASKPIDFGELLSVVARLARRTA